MGLLPLAVVGVALAGIPAGGSVVSPTVSGLSRVVPRCSDDLAAECWQQARPLRRFAAAPGLHHGPVQASVSLAWDDTGLLVRVDALPEGAWLEVGLGVKAADGLLSRMEPLRARSPGIHRLTPTRALVAGEVRRAVVNVVVPDGEGAAALAWSPAGPATPSHLPRLLFAEHPGVGLPVMLSTEGEQWSFEAIGGDEVRMSHLRPAIPAYSRGVPDAWTVHGQGAVSAAASPEWGMHEVVAVWRDDKDVPVDLIARRVWSEPPAPAGVSGDALFFPPPKELVTGGGVVTLDPRPSLCVAPELEGPGDLLARELARMTGTPVAEGDGCTLSVVTDDRLPAHGFRLEVSREGMIIAAPDRLGATAGALALVDALGPDRQMPALTVTDWPTVAERPLYHSLNQPNRPDLSVDDYLRFIERVVARGRYSQLHLFLSDGMASSALPEVARGNAWGAEEVARIRVLCDQLGIALVPGINAPGHAGWMLRSHPELIEDVNASLLDVRHPRTRGLLAAYYDDVWTAFGRPPAVHIGHDEAVWQTQRWFADEQNPRNATTPRALLFADDLRFHLAWCKERGITPYIWTDMLLEGWNGRRDGAHLALDLLSEEERGMLRAMAWSPLGDPFENLHERYGIPVLRVHTGYLDWKRAGLNDRLDAIAGEGLALFLPAPWASFAPGPGTRSLHYHLGVIVLAGATAWSPELEPAALIAPTLAGLAGHPVLRPGFEAISHRRARPLWSAGDRPGADLPEVAWPLELTSDDLTYRTDPRVARVDAPVSFAVSRPRDTAGVSVLLAAAPSHSARAELRRTINRHRDTAHQAVGWVVLEHEDGTQTRHPLEYGEDIYALDAGPLANAQWRSADVVPLASPVVAHLHPEGRDRRLYRIDVPIPVRGSTVVAVRVEATKPGIPLVVGAASLLLR